MSFPHLTALQMARLRWPKDIKATILEALKNGPVEIVDLYELVWGLEGEDWPEKGLSTHIWRLNKVLKQQKSRIVCTGKGPRGYRPRFYRLEYNVE